MSAFRSLPSPTMISLLVLQGMAIGDGLCDPESMTDYGNFLFGIGLIDEDDRDYFIKVSKLQVDFIKEQKWFQAFQVRHIK